MIISLDFKGLIRCFSCGLGWRPLPKVTLCGRGMAQTEWGGLQAKLGLYDRRQGNACQAGKTRSRVLHLEFSIRCEFLELESWTMGLSFLLSIIFVLFFCIWLRWVFIVVHGLSLVAASGGYSLLQCEGSSCCRVLAPERWLLWFQ